MFPYACSLTDSPQLIHKSSDHKDFQWCNGGQRVDGKWWMVNNEWRDWKWKMFHMFARQINDFETHTYAIPETTFLFSSNLLLNIIQEYNSIFFFCIFFLLFFFLRNFIPSFCFWFFFSSNKYEKIKCTPTLAFWYITIQSEAKGHKKSLSSSCKHNKTRVRWCGWTKETANECLVQKGIPKVRV